MTRSVLVTGAASGIGRATALAAARRGWSVALLDRDATGVELAADEAHDTGAPIAIGVEVDVTNEIDLERGFTKAEAVIGSLDGIVASAGIEVSAHVLEATLADWHRILDVNLTGTFLTVREAGRRLRSAGRPGSIVCVSSPSAFVGFAGGSNTAYGASKGGISAFTRAAALDLAPFGLRVNAVVPGATDTPMLYFGLEGAELEAERRRLRAASKAQIPLGRMADPGEVAAAVAWLLSDESSYVTGSHLVCDGGLMAKSANDF